jgi:serine-type D-Ala-D-Ala carboxypeptidase (penicillin-binding protein 5/6)
MAQRKLLYSSPLLLMLAVTMKLRWILLLCLALLSNLARADALPQAPELAARSWLLLDAGSNQVLASARPDDRAEPASLTKLMTAYVVFQALRAKTISLNQQVTISDRVYQVARSREESVMFLDPRKPVTVDELIHGVIIQSGNDACVALAELVAGSEARFVERMNREAQRLGMSNTQFRNVTGITEAGHYSTPRDLAKIATAIIRDFPEYFPIYSQKQFTYNKITQPNRNRLLWQDPSVDGMKTGHTAAAGYCLVSTAHRGPRRVISVVMGTASDKARAQESQKLLNFGFEAFDMVQFFKAQQTVGALPLREGKLDKINAGFMNDLLISVPHGRAAEVKLQLLPAAGLKAPLARGAKLGSLRLLLDGQVLGEYPLLALQDVERANWFMRGIEALRNLFR